MDLQQDSSGTYSDWNSFLQPFQYPAEAGVPRSHCGALYFSGVPNVNGLKYTARHSLVEVFSCIIVRPMFVNTDGWESAGESGIRPLHWKDVCYIPCKIQLAPLLLNIGAALIFLASVAQIDLGALTSQNYSNWSGYTCASQNARTEKKQWSQQLLIHGCQLRTTCPPSCANNSNWHSMNFTVLCL